jgi:hypothetical protein
MNGDLTSRKSYSGKELNLELRIKQLKEINPDLSVTEFLKAIGDWEKDLQAHRDLIAVTPVEVLERGHY